MADDNNNSTGMDDDTIAMEGQEDGEGTSGSGSGGVVVAWSAIWVTALVAALQSVVFYIFFMVQRNREKANDSYALYEPRHFHRSHRSPSAFGDDGDDGEESWWKAAWKIDPEELLRCVGLDSFMFLRFLRLGARMATVGTLCSLILIPTYATGGAQGEATMEFNSLTLAKVEQGSHRMWATVVFWWIFVAFVLRDFWMEWTVGSLLLFFVIVIVFVFVLFLLVHSQDLLLFLLPLLWWFHTTNIIIVICAALFQKSIRFLGQGRSRYTERF